MFLSNSRYTNIETVETTNSDGRKVTALKLRRIPPTSGQAYEIKDNDQLDHLALQRLKDPTQFWHIADANTELEARNLLLETGRQINVPES